MKNEFQRYEDFIENRLDEIALEDSEFLDVFSELMEDKECVAQLKALLTVSINYNYNYEKLSEAVKSSGYTLARRLHVIATEDAERKYQKDLEDRESTEADRRLDEKKDREIT